MRFKSPNAPSAFGNALAGEFDAAYHGPNPNSAGLGIQGLNIPYPYTGSGGVAIGGAGALLGGGSGINDQALQHEADLVQQNFPELSRDQALDAARQIVSDGPPAGSTAGPGTGIWGRAPSAPVGGGGTPDTPSISPTPEPSIGSLFNDFASANNYIWNDWNKAPLGFKLGQSYNAVSNLLGGVKNLGHTYIADKAVASGSPIAQYAAVGAIAFGNLLPESLAEFAPVGKLGKFGRVGEDVAGRLSGEFTSLKFQGNRTYALVPSNDGIGPLRWIRTDRIDPAPSIHGNSLSNPDPTHVYAIRDESGSIWKIGESAQGVNGSGLSARAEQQVRDLNLLYPDKFFKSEIRAWLPNKAEARAYETQVIDRYRSFYGQDTLPGNITNR